jgi:hypothetical protein
MILPEGGSSQVFLPVFDDTKKDRICNSYFASPVLA